MSGFPQPLQIGQGLTPNELDLDQFVKASHFQRLRDRDEYVMDIIKGGAGAPESLNVSGLTIAGQGPIITPTVVYKVGLSYAHGSWMENPDFWYWWGEWNGYVAWHTLIESWITLGALGSPALVTANFGWHKVNIYGFTSIYRLLVNGVVVSTINLTRDWRPSVNVQIEGFNGCLNWAGTLPGGSSQFHLQHLQYGSPGFLGRAIHNSSGSPTLTVIAV